MRVLLITGGGGAGVTTFAVATAVLAARTGMRTRLLGTDPASIESVLGPTADRPRLLTTNAPQPDDVLVVLDRLRQIADLQSNRADMRLRR